MRSNNYGCLVCRRMTSGRCPDCRERNKRYVTQRRIKNGTIKIEKCFRCLNKHPVGERFCFLAAEWNGYPWNKECE